MNKYLSILLVLFFVWLPLVPAQAPYQVNTLLAGSLNGIYYPALCGGTNKPFWCANDPNHPGTIGSTPDSWVRAACTQVPSTGGIVDFYGMTGNVAATTRGCSTPFRKIVFIQDPGASSLNITETDGDIPFALDNNSMFLGFGSGGCNPNQAINVDPSAIITAVVGPAHIDGSQEQFTAQGLCIYGHAGATISEGIIYSQSNFANTTISNNNIFECGPACVHVINSSSITIANNWLNVTDGTIPSVSGRGIWVQSLTLSTGTGCKAGNINITQGQIEHGYGGVSDIDVSGDGAGAIICNVRIDVVGVERNNVSGSTIGINLADCWNCSVDHSLDSGTNGGTSFIKISQSAPGRTLNVSVTNLNPGGTYTNVIEDDTPGGRIFTTTDNPQITKYIAQPGLVAETLYSVALNPLPSCTSATYPSQKFVSDATSPTYLGSYTGSGSITTRVLCSFNGTTYQWITE